MLSMDSIALWISVYLEFEFRIYYSRGLRLKNLMTFSSLKISDLTGSEIAYLNLLCRWYWMLIFINRFLTCTYYFSLVTFNPHLRDRFIPCSTFFHIENPVFLRSTSPSGFKFSNLLKFFITCTAFSAKVYLSQHCLTVPLIFYGQHCPPNIKYLSILQATPSLLSFSTI